MISDHVEWHRQEGGQSLTKQWGESVNHAISPVIMASSPSVVEIDGALTDAVKEEELDVHL